MIRNATPGDAGALVPLLTELGYPADAEQVAHRLATLVEDDWSGVWVTDRSDGIVAVASAHASPLLTRETRVCRITAFVVGRAAQGGGVGRALVERVEQEARRWKCDRIEVTSSDHREGAHTFYRRLGFAAKPTRFIKDLPVL